MRMTSFDITAHKIANGDRRRDSRVERLCNALGWKGGTINKVALELGVTTADILRAPPGRMNDLVRKAHNLRVLKSQNHSDFPPAA